MTTGWEYFRERLETIDRTSTHTMSIHKSLTEIAEWAENNGLDPTRANNASVSNLEEIIRLAKIAILDERKQDVQKLLDLTGEVSNAHLREILRGNRFPVIYVTKEAGENGGTYLFRVAGSEMNRIMMATKGSLRFEIIEGE